jgi:hypothetical protein
VIRRHAPLLALAASLLVLPGCGWLLGPAIAGGGMETGTSSDQEAATANVRGSIPAVEAYYADHGSYAGATVEELRAYDYGIQDVSVFPAADGVTYCIESTVGSLTVSRPGPAGEFRPGGC